MTNFAGCNQSDNLTVTEIMETDKQKQITTIMKKSTNNYERPEVQVVYVETEAGFASESGDKINSPANGYSWGDEDIENL